MTDKYGKSFGVYIAKENNEQIFNTNDEFRRFFELMVLLCPNVFFEKDSAEQTKHRLLKERFEMKQQRIIDHSSLSIENLQTRLEKLRFKKLLIQKKLDEILL